MTTQLIDRRTVAQEIAYCAEFAGSPDGLAYCYDDIVRALKDYIARHSNQKAAAKALGITQPYISDLVRQRRRIHKYLAGRLGFQELTIWVKRGSQ